MSFMINGQEQSFEVVRTRYDHDSLFITGHDAQNSFKNRSRLIEIKIPYPKTGGLVFPKEEKGYLTYKEFSDQYSQEGTTEQGEISITNITDSNEEEQVISGKFAGIIEWKEPNRWGERIFKITNGIFRVRLGKIMYCSIDYKKTPGKKSLQNQWKFIGFKNSKSNEIE